MFQRKQTGGPDIPTGYSTSLPNDCEETVDSTEMGPRFDIARASSLSIRELKTFHRQS